jgi:Transcriptional regulatory protein, C terminal
MADDANVVLRYRLEDVVDTTVSARSCENVSLTTYLKSMATVPGQARAGRESASIDAFLEGRRAFHNPVRSWARKVDARSVRGCTSVVRLSSAIVQRSAEAGPRCMLEWVRCPRVCREAAPWEVRFGDFIVDTDTRELLRESRPVHLSPKAFQLLELLVTARPRALSKDALYKRLWPNTFVVEANLSNLVGELRAAIG